MIEEILIEDPVKKQFVGKRGKKIVDLDMGRGRRLKRKQTETDSGPVIGQIR